jgi:hypothetical protein
MTIFEACNLAKPEFSFKQTNSLICQEIGKCYRSSESVYI